VSIDLSAKAVTVTHAASCVSALEAAVAAAGYPVSAPAKAAGPLLSTTALMVPGMMCLRNCGSKVTAALKAVPGVHGASRPE
jgi:copper chaperone CopZ